MAYLDKNGTKLSSCIVAKARYALGITSQKPNNDKTCSAHYWERVIEVVGIHHEIPTKEILKAGMLYNDLFSN